MLVTIIRHGEAGPASRDKDRRLTQRGEEEVGVAAKALAKACQAAGLPLPDVTRFSDYERTKQTAEILQRHFNTGSFLQAVALRSESQVQSVQTLLDELLSDPANAGFAHVLLVSHQPLVSELCLHYCEELAPLSPGAFFSFDLPTNEKFLGVKRFAAYPPAYSVQK